jgi:hypothetical protein
MLIPLFVSQVALSNHIFLSKVSIPTHLQGNIREKFDSDVVLAKAQVLATVGFNLNYVRSLILTFEKLFDCPMINVVSISTPLWGHVREKFDSDVGPIRSVSSDLQRFNLNSPFGDRYVRSLILTTDCIAKSAAAAIRFNLNSP